MLMIEKGKYDDHTKVTTWWISRILKKQMHDRRERHQWDMGKAEKLNFTCRLLGRSPYSVVPGAAPPGGLSERHTDGPATDAPNQKPGHWPSSEFLQVLQVIPGAPGDVGACLSTTAFRFFLKIKSSL